MVNNLIFFLRNKFIFHGLNVAAKISFQRREIKKIEKTEPILSERERRTARERWSCAIPLKE